MPATTVCTILFSSSNFRKNLPNAVSKMLLQEKLDTYRSLCIKRFAILEGGTIFAIVAYFLTGHSLVACCVVAGLFMFISLRPTKEKIIQELVLSNEEAAFLN